MSALLSTTEQLRCIRMGESRAIHTSHIDYHMLDTNSILPPALSPQKQHRRRHMDPAIAIGLEKRGYPLTPLR